MIFFIIILLACFADIFSMKTVTLLENLILQDCFDQDEVKELNIIKF